MPGRLEFDVALGRQGRARPEGEPLRLLLLGDFSGRPAAERAPLATRPTLQVDLDSLPGVIGRLAPQLRLPAGALTITDIDDFHPDRLVTRLAVFKELREKRSQPPTEPDDSLARLLGTSKSAGSEPAATPGGGLDAFIHQIVAPHIVKDASSHAKLFVDAVDAALADQMRAVLHDPAFQALEAAWRGVQWLLSSLELDEHLQLHLLDVTRDEVLADIVAAQGTVTETGLYRAIVDRWREVPGADGWAAFVTLFEFGPSARDAGLLAALGLIAARGGAPVLGGAALELVDVDATSAADWHALRQSEVARWIGLAAPRVLLRLPYGRRHEPVETFQFEEFEGEPAHAALLWGNATLALALLVGRSFTARGWDMELGDEREIGDLPAYTFVRDGEVQLQPCAEDFLPESRLQHALDAGLMPIASRRDRNGVVVIRFQSIAHPAAPLAWRPGASGS